MWTIQTHFKLKSHPNSLFLRVNDIYQIDFKLCTEYDSIIAVLCAKFQND